MTPLAQEPIRPRPPSLRMRLRAAFLRVLALALLALGVLHWAVLLGAPGLPGPFDLPVAALVVNVVLAVAFPIAAVGVWIGAGWGVVVWLAVALTQAVSHGWFSAEIGSAPYLLGFHVVSMLIYVALTIAARAPGVE